MTDKLKKYETIGCCGIDCGLCPAFYTKGDSACPGCGGLNFKEKHPSCGFLTCCVVKNGFELCADCHDYPCKRFDSEKEGFDSFVTHKKVFSNLDDVKNKGIEQFIANQRIRLNILIDLLTNFNDGRSKSFYCIACTLLPIDKLQEVHSFVQSLSNENETNEKIKKVKNYMIAMARSLEIELKLNKKK